MEQSIGDRIRIFGEATFKSVNAFADAMIMSPPALQSYLRGKSHPGTPVLLKLQKLGCNIDWLLSGEEKRPRVSDDKRSKYLFPIVSSLSAGEKKMIFDDDNGIDHIEVPYKGKNCFALRVIGDSMSPNFDDGDIVLVDPNKVPKKQDFVAVRTSDSDQLIKRYYPSEDEVLLISDNPQYAPISISKKKIMLLYKVVLAVRIFK